MSGHTPGPWRVNPGAGEVRGADWNVIVADVASDADARLIAAAPDLLALADAVIAAHWEGGGAWGRTLRLAHVARALATGEASGGKMHVAEALVRDVGYEDERANARLIAAAPDLLDACVRLLDAVARGDHKAKAIDAARAAVAKATGGKP